MKQNLETLFESQQNAFRATPYSDLNTRLHRLTRLEQLLKKYEIEFCEAISQDFGCRTGDETRLLEMFPSFAGIRHAKKHLKKWMKAEKRAVSLTFQPAKARVFYQPLGVIGIIVPWNYPLFLAIGPMVSAMAAGNHLMVKISESTENFGRVFAKAVAEFFPEDLVTVVNGSVEVAQQFTQLAFHHLLFTGSTSVGKKVMAAAAKNLTPVTLELGGKSPTILDVDIDIDKAAERVIITKLLNAGQTCVAPDYVLLPEQSLNQFVVAAKKWAKKYYPDWLNTDYTSIINQTQYQRQKSLLDEIQASDVVVEALFEGEDDDHNHKLIPRLVINPEPQQKVMKEEIFGPILPLVTYKEFEQALDWVNQRQRPLALYLFSRNNLHIERTIQQTHAGGVAINECLLHVAQENLPFGGVGPSGMGHYHGRDGFITFSKAKGVFYQSRLNGASLLTPPYAGLTKKLLKLLLKIG